MTKSFQKTANSLQELQLPHPGIINADDFDAHFDLHCYMPSSDLRPFVEHIWTQRLKHPLDNSYVPPAEVMSGPHVYMFFTPSASFVHSIAKRTFAYNPAAHDVIAGIKFRPGGFYPFLRRPLTTLQSASLPASSVFTDADDAFTSTLLTQPDHRLVAMLEDLLRRSRPQSTPSLSMVARIMERISTDSSLRTVSATADAFEMSERTLQLLFHTHVGVGVKWIITRKRLLDAIGRVRHQPRLTWAEVAAELGYSSQSHFSREFKDVTGLAPSAYLKSL